MVKQHSCRDSARAPWHIARKEIDASIVDILALPAWRADASITRWRIR
jgi:hypothetical protein